MLKLHCKENDSVSVELNLQVVDFLMFKNCSIGFLFSFLEDLWYSQHRKMGKRPIFSAEGTYSLHTDHGSATVEPSTAGSVIRLTFAVSMIISGNISV